MCNFWINFTIYLVGIFSHSVSSLKITKFTVPPQEAHEANLICQFDLNGEKLYDVKWYKDDQNFLRCSDEGIQRYPVDGIIIGFVEPMASSCSLTLTGLTLKTAGLYKCEITLEAPSFPTVSKKGDMRVTSVSKYVQSPEITEPPFLVQQASKSSKTATNLISIIILSYYHVFGC